MKPEEIAQQRLALGFTQDELAKRFGIELKLLQDWESGADSPPHPKLLELAFDALKGNWVISSETQAEIGRVQQFIKASQANMVKAAPKS